ASVDSWPAAENAQANNRPSVLHRRRILSGARRRADVGVGRAVCALRAFRRIDSLGVQHGAAPARSAGPVSRARVRRGTRDGDADVVALELLDGIRAGSGRMVAGTDGIRARSALYHSGSAVDRSVVKMAGSLAGGSRVWRDRG